MTQRLNFYGIAPKAFEPLMGIEAILKAGTLEHTLLELVKIRASQINGCANCLHMHTSDARKAGETEAADLPAERLAGIQPLLGPGARGAGLDRGPDPDRRDPRAGRGL